jgi:hypothetical protein
MFRLLEDKLLGMRREVTTRGYEEKKKIMLFAWLVGWVVGLIDWLVGLGLIDWLVGWVWVDLLVG